MIKAVRRNGGNCVCPRDNWERRVEGTCRFRYCMEFRCPDCGGELAGWGPIACPHKKRDMPRWVRHDEMRDLSYFSLEIDDLVPVHIAIKPSIAKRTRRRVN